MSLKDIKEYLMLTMEGDSTIDQRLEMFQKQKRILQAQMEELQDTMDTLEFKCWYYETAKAAGTTDVLKNMSIDQIPERFRKVRRNLLNMENDEPS